MSYLPTWIAVAVGLVLLVAVLVRSARTVRRFGATASAVNARFGDETGHLRARSAALRVAMKETRARVKHTPADVPSERRGRQEDDRG
ncbi:bacteriophage holin [Actinophytocola gossypii]|uniref:Bacteriophage holin n=1 Tax=Actinophytocola gossypii TaxID=2812003 RepID=A0ABT2J6Z2_9PSEU|nr:bacteriophage holin [Actinophytocola gossypii]MCT2583619.1 bacteriophage holin [Actinophytocola gossypii]